MSFEPGRTTGLVLAGLVAIAALSGCSTAPAPGADDALTTSPQTSVGAPSGTVPGADQFTGSKHLPGREWAQTMVRCMAEKGWVVDISPDDPTAIDAQYPSAQQAAYDQDIVACMNENDLSADPPPIDAVAAERAWEEYTAAAACMRERGLEPAEPPSKEKFIAEQLAGGSSWHPHRVGQGEENAARSVIADCPISNDYILFGVRYPDE